MIYKKLCPCGIIISATTVKSVCEALSDHGRQTGCVTAQAVNK